MQLTGINKTKNEPPVTHTRWYEGPCSGIMDITINQAPITNITDITGIKTSYYFILHILFSYINQQCQFPVIFVIFPNGVTYTVIFGVDP